MRWVLLAATLLIGTASAHVPSFADAGVSPATAFHVRDPDQSRVFYGELGPGAQHWFKFDRSRGDAIDVSVHLPVGESGRPALWIVGPGLVGEGPRQTPSELGGSRAPPLDDVSVEPFTPLAMRLVGQWSQPAPADGTFFVVIEADSGATYSVAIGRGEAFTITEWVGIPIQRVGIMDWAGVPWPVTVAGEVLAIAVVGGLAWRRGVPLPAGVGFVAAGAMAGTGLTTLVLALLAAFQGGITAGLAIPALFAALAFGTGWGAYRAVAARQPWKGLLWAALGLAVWAGLVVGPLALGAWSLWRLSGKWRGAAPPSDGDLKA